MTDTAHPATAAPAAEKTTLDIIDIFHILPHRFPFLLIDRVIEIQRKQRIVAIKNVTINEPFFAGHFPNLPIMPGVLIVEAIAQAGGALLLTEVEDRQNKLIMFTGIERAKFRRPVVPGDQLRIEVELKNWRARPSMIAVRMEGIVYVGAKRVAEAVVSCQLVDTARGRAGPMAQQRRTNRNHKLPYGQTSAVNYSSAADSMAKSSTGVHPTAIVDPRAKVHPSCKIGPYCVIGPEVELGEGCHLVSHVTIEGPTKIGADNGFFPFCSIGMAPQDMTYAGEPTRLEIGDHNEIREFVTINRGTVKGGGLTRVGSHTLVMAYTHIAHDCDIGDHVILANAATLGGHITVGEWAVVGALCPVHHFVRIGAHAFIGGGTTITRDVLPFSKTAAARDTHAYGLNAVGLERRGFSKERIRKIHHAYKLLQASKLNTSQALERMKSEPDRGEDVDMLIKFIEASERGVIK